MMMSYYDRFLDFPLCDVAICARKFLLLHKELKGKIVLQDSMQHDDSSQF